MNGNKISPIKVRFHTLTLDCCKVLPIICIPKDSLSNSRVAIYFRAFSNYILYYTVSLGCNGIYM